MKKFIIIGIIIIIIAVLFWFFYPLRSYLVMGIYSGQHHKQSVMRQNGFDIAIPSGRGWYPFVMTYNANGFQSWSGIDANMTILYNFGAFDIGTRTSSIYDCSSDKYSSFYGVYAVQKKKGQFGYLENDCIDIKEISKAVEYDYTQLVIKDFGCKDLMFCVDRFDIAEDVEYLDSDGWTRMEAVITANGAAHTFEDHKRPYFQYGRPMKTVKEDFALTELYGRVYAKYLDEYNCTVMFYVIAPTLDAVDVCDKTILQKATIQTLEH